MPIKSDHFATWHKVMLQSDDARSRWPFRTAFFIGSGTKENWIFRRRPSCLPVTLRKAVLQSRRRVPRVCEHSIFFSPSFHPHSVVGLTSSPLQCSKEANGVSAGG